MEASVTRRPKHELEGRASLVDELIDQITADLSAAGAKPGHFLGRQSDLCERYGVTSQIFFQATRVLIDRGLVELRQGNRGGLFVAESSFARCGKRMATYLECVGVDFADAVPISRMLQELCVRLGTGQLSQDAANAVRDLIAGLSTEPDYYERYALTARLCEIYAAASGNVILRLLYRAITDVMLDFAVLERDRDRSVPQIVIIDLAIAISEAVIGGDHEQSAALYRQFSDTLIRKQTAEKPRRRDAIHKQGEELSRGRNLPERLAQEILREIRARGWPVGERLGREQELLDRFGVSRATFRQASRLLKEYSVVETLRGAGGGLVIAAPSASVINETGFDLLRRSTATREHVQVILIPMMMLVLESALDSGEEGFRNVAQECRRLARADMPAPAKVATLVNSLLCQANVKTLDLFIRLVAAVDLELGSYGNALELRKEASGLLEGMAEAVVDTDISMARLRFTELIKNVGPGHLSVPE